MTVTSDIHAADNQALFLPLGGKIGATRRVEGLIFELEHTNIDWKHVVEEFRSYLYDFIYDIVPYAESVLPVIFFYLFEAVKRKKMSAIRSSDTFFDRYIFIVKELKKGNDNFSALEEHFAEHIPSLLEIMTKESDEGYFFGSVNNRVKNLGSGLLETGLQRDHIIISMGCLLKRQYSLYVERSIVITGEETCSLKERLEGTGLYPDLSQYVEKLSFNNYEKNKASLEEIFIKDPGGVLRRHEELLDFNHNARQWEQVCLLVKRSIEEGILSDGEQILFVISFIIKKSHEGANRELQLFMSRTVASICNVLVERRYYKMLGSVLDLVMPILLKEIENEGNFSSAFLTIYNLGKTIISSQVIWLIDYFIDILVEARFCFPEFTGVADDWSVMVNASHLENIRTWMRLIELDPLATRKLAASLIVNLKLGGVFLKDTDVFQRDITELLNSNYGDTFYLITSLAAVFPAFYHDIGATGNIRAFTEKIDTNHEMNDLIHFMRKQVHVESSSRTVLLFQKVMDFWLKGDKTILAGLIPTEVYDNLDSFYTMSNLALQPWARIIYEEARKHFSAFSDYRFWDFFDAVDQDEFFEFFESNRFEGVSNDEYEEFRRHVEHYFKTSNITEVKSILEHIAYISGIEETELTLGKIIYEVSDDEFRKIFDVVSKCDISRVNVEKFITLLHVYRMLYDKYNFSDIRGIEKLEIFAQENLFSPPDGFFRLLRESSKIEAMEALLSLQAELKENILLNPERFEPLDTIEFKRHIAFGIPSMYGSYKEKKFDTLKVFFHINLVRLSIFENMLDEITGDNEDTHIDYEQVTLIIKLFTRAFVIDGLVNQEMVTIADLFNTPNMRISQYRDVVNYLLTIHGEISDRFNERFKDVCRVSVKKIGIARISERFIPNGQPQDIETITDRLLRDQIMQSPHLQLFDNFLMYLRDRIAADQKTRGDRICLNRCTGRDARGHVAFAIEKSAKKSAPDRVYAPVWEVGGKAHGLLFAVNTPGVNVPRGFIISSEVYKRVRDGNLRNPRFIRKIRHVLKKYIDEFTGGRFANSENPMLFSVRSGAVFSMPGVMDTITNVGITQDILDSMARHDKWFAYDCFRRLIQDLAISSFEMERGIFENLMNEAKDEAGVTLKEKMTGKQMEELTLRYRYAINSFGFSVPKDPYDQLIHAIIAVYESWDSNIAKNYRQYINISDRWGTAVVVQQMVFGNYSPLNITGVVHSQYLGRENISLFGEYKTRAQGHDIVSGVAKVFPISEEQKKIYEKSSQYPSMEQKFPHVYSKLFALVKEIRDRWRNDVEIEFTVENDILYVLQIRGMTSHVFTVETINAAPEDLEKNLLGQGLAASGGAVSGRVVFDIDRIDRVRKKYENDKVILVRPETNPEDVIGLKKSDGILTCIGGMTSHAVLQMRRLEKSGVSDFSAMKIDEEKRVATVYGNGSGKEPVSIGEGDFITIDGNTGFVYRGFYPTQ